MVRIQLCDETKVILFGGRFIGSSFSRHAKEISNGETELRRKDLDCQTWQMTRILGRELTIFTRFFVERYIKSPHIVLLLQDYHVVAKISPVQAKPQ